MITPKILNGFRDFLPETMILKKDIITRLQNIFELFGFSPIDTPALEYTEILLGKGSGETDKQIYRFNDHGNRDVSLRFDLTVPLARFVSQYYNELVFPFKAYHIAPVWRGERKQKGRFREFYQCDFDILGVDTIEPDLEILLVINAGMKALNIGNYCINVNSRKILNFLLKKYKLNDKSTEILREIDKIYKTGYDSVVNEITNTLKIDTDIVKIIFDTLNITPDTKTEIKGDDIFDYLESIKTTLGDDENNGINDMFYIFKTLKEVGVIDSFSLNPSITRGLDYYTGIVFETFFQDHIDFGSVCSGGRYDNLTSLYSKNIVPGVGASFGLDRIISLMEDKNITAVKKSNTDLLIFNIDAGFYPEYIKIAEFLRNKKINVEVYYQQKKIGTQFKFAENKSIRYVLFIGENEIKNKKYNLKDLMNKQEKNNVTINEIADIININK